MLNIDKINEEIKALEDSHYTSYGVCEKLAMLYTVRDHYAGSPSKPEEMKVEASHATRVI